MNSTIKGKSGLERFLCFSLGKEEYAIPLLVVREVIAMPEFTPVPYTPTYFLGIMNLRGQVISLMDLRQKLGITPRDDAETTVVICDLNGISLGVVVDSVNSVVSPNAEEISPKPEIQSNKPTDYIKAVYRKDHRLILFLDLAKSLNLEDRQAIEKSASEKNKEAA